MPFEHHIEVIPSDIDQMGHVNNVVYVRYVQEIAEAHWKSIASETLQKDVVWVVLRHEIDYKQPAFANQKLIGKTWVEEAQGVKMPRIVTVENQEGIELIKARTIWCALNGATHKPTRISESLYNLFK